MIICAVIIVAYTALGGFLAASTTDLIQSIVMTIALVVVLGYGTSQAGGVDAVMDNAKSLAGYLSLTSTHDVVGNVAKPYGIITIISTLAWGLGYFGMPHILLRFMATEDEEKLTLSRRIATAHQCVVCVEGGDDVQPILRKAGIAQQRAAQLSRANQYGIVRVIISEIYLNVLNQAFAVISDLGPSAVADEREILSNLDFTHIQPCGDGRGGNIDRSVGRKRFQIGEIGRHPLLNIQMQVLC